MCPHHCATHTAREPSWRRAFDPCAPLLFILYHYLELNLHFGLVPEPPQVLSARSCLVAGFDTLNIPRSFRWSVAERGVVICKETDGKESEEQDVEINMQRARTADASLPKSLRNSYVSQTCVTNICKERPYVKRP